jgi:hypothetical protein
VDEKDIQALVARVRQLEDEREIMRSLNQYGHTLDYGREDEFLDCFTEDGAWISSNAQRRRAFEGRVGLLQFFNNHTHAPEYWHKHLILLPQIALNGDEAVSRSYYVRIDEHPEGAYVRSFGHYTDKLVRCPDGRWRIKERLVEGEGTGSPKTFPPPPAWTQKPELGRTLEPLKR